MLSALPCAALPCAALPYWKPYSLFGHAFGIRRCGTDRLMDAQRKNRTSTSRPTFDILDSEGMTPDGGGGVATATTTAKEFSGVQALVSGSGGQIGYYL